MTRTSFNETAFAKVALPAAVMLLRLTVLVLVVVSMHEVLLTILNIIHDIEHKNEILLLGALMTVLVPTGGVLFWGGRAILMPLEKPSRVMYRYFLNYRDKISDARRGTP